MKINTVLLKDKSISINQLKPTQNLHINMNRLNLMPNTIQGKNLQCELHLNINIENEDKKLLANIGISYIVIAILDEDDVYEQNEIADRLYKVLQSMFIYAANNLLQETPLPPIPINITC